MGVDTEYTWDSAELTRSVKHRPGWRNPVPAQGATRGKLADLPRIDDGQVAELADAMDSKSIDRKVVRVQLPPWPPLVRGTHDSLHQNKVRYGASKIVRSNP